MKMKIIWHIANTAMLIIVLGSFSLSAQRFKLDAGLGYGIGLTSTYHNTEVVESLMFSGVNNLEQRSERFDYNQGITGHLKFNYMLNQELFVVAGARYQSGQRKYGPNIYISDSPVDIDYRSEYSFSYEQLDVQVGLGVEKKLSDRWSVYLSHGFTFFVHGRATTESSQTMTGSGSSYATREFIRVDRPRFTFGAYGDVGVIYKLSDHFNLFFNATVQSKNWSTKDSKVTRFEIDGVDQLPTSSVSQLETVYYSSVETILSSTPVDPDQPSTSSQTWMPNSGLEAVLGVRVNFGAESVQKEIHVRKLGLYIQGAFGYGMPMSELTKVSNELNIFENPVSYSESYESNLYSYGKGFSGQLLLGHSIGNGFSLEIGGVFNTSEYSNYYKQTEFWSGLLDTETIMNNVYSAWMIRNTYGVKLESQFKRINAFLRTGLSLGFAGLKESSEIVGTDYLTPSFTLIEREYQYSGNVSLGAYIGLGSSVRLSDRFDLIGEAVTYIQNWAPSRRETTQFTVNGIDQLDGASVYSKELEFVSEINDPIYDANSPQKALRISEPFSSFMITVGIRFNITGKK